jgi:hypothetical protein
MWYQEKKKCFFKHQNYTQGSKMFWPTFRKTPIPHLKQNLDWVHWVTGELSHWPSSNCAFFLQESISSHSKLVRSANTCTERCYWSFIKRIPVSPCPMETQFCKLVAHSSFVLKFLNSNLSHLKMISSLHSHTVQQRTTKQLSVPMVSTFNLFC